jgi:hypothetical protein
VTAPRRLAIAIACAGLAGCERAPSFDILGSYFPAWLVCLCVSLALTVLTRSFLLRRQIEVVAPVVVYPSLLAVFTFTQWLMFFR